MMTNISFSGRSLLRPSIALIVVSLLFVAMPNSRAALPASVDGQMLPSLAPMVVRASPAVVNIASTKIQRGGLVRDPFWGRIYRQPPRKAQSLGSGVIIDAAKGYILTNNHVIEGASEITVRLHDGRQLQAHLLGSDKASDIAVIQVKADKLTALPLADSDQLRVGDFVVAIGNPFNLGQSVTSGIVSALGRQGLGIEHFEDFIQTDAAINPGNSGGALVNLRGELVGINTAIIGPAGGNVGIGFAIPINHARALMQQLIRYGKVRRGLLGIRGDSLTAELATALELNIHRGVVITSVTPRSAAASAGLKIYDVITAIGERKVFSLAQINNRIGLMPAGEKIKLNIIRNGKSRLVSVKIRQIARAHSAGTMISPMLTGLDFEQALDAAGVPDGVRIRKVAEDSRGAYWGLKSGDVVIGVGKYSITRLQRLKKLLGGYRGPLALKIRREDRLIIVTVR